MANPSAVIQAGGRGTRLAPYSTVLPKALMPVGDSCIIDKLLTGFAGAGVSSVSITVSTFGPLIRSYCGDGARWGLTIEYLTEDEPLGTIGPLNAIRHTVTEPFIVTNSDVFTDVSLDSVLAAHRAHAGPLTVVVTDQRVNIAYGVLDHRSGYVTDFREKPTQQFSVSTGIYVMDPSIFDYIPSTGPFGFDELMRTLLARRVPVHVYEHHGSWIDIGRVEDLRRAQEHAELTMRSST